MSRSRQILDPCQLDSYALVSAAIFNSPLESENVSSCSAECHVGKCIEVRKLSLTNEDNGPSPAFGLAVQPRS